MIKLIPAQFLKSMTQLSAAECMHIHQSITPAWCCVNAPPSIVMLYLILKLRIYYVFLYVYLCHHDYMSSLCVHVLWRNVRYVNAGPVWWLITPPARPVIDPAHSCWLDASAAGHRLDPDRVMWVTLFTFRIHVHAEHGCLFSSVMYKNRHYVICQHYISVRRLKAKVWRKRCPIVRPHV